MLRALYLTMVFVGTAMIISALFVPRSAIISGGYSGGMYYFYLPDTGVVSFNLTQPGTLFYLLAMPVFINATSNLTLPAGWYAFYSNGSFSLAGDLQRSSPGWKVPSKTTVTVWTTDRNQTMSIQLAGRGTLRVASNFSNLFCISSGVNCTGVTNLSTYVSWQLLVGKNITLYLTALDPGIYNVAWSSESCHGCTVDRLALTLGLLLGGFLLTGICLGLWWRSLYTPETQPLL